MALVALAHAVTTLVQMPFAPSSIAIHPAPIFTINMGTKNGDTRSWDFSKARVCSRSIVPIPPTPEE